MRIAANPNVSITSLHNPFVSPSHFGSPKLPNHIQNTYGQICYKTQPLFSDMICLDAQVWKHPLPILLTVKVMQH